MSSLIEAPEELQEEHDARADAACIATLPSAPRRGLSNLIAYLRALTAPAARRQCGRSSRVSRPDYPPIETPQDLLTLKYPDLYIRCMSI
jgi:hypothetical protein